MRTPFSGVGTALITPFTRDGSLDEAAVKRLIRRAAEVAYDPKAARAKITMGDPDLPQL